MLGPLQNFCKLLIWILKPTKGRRNDLVVKTIAVQKNLHFKSFLFQALTLNLQDDNDSSVMRNPLSNRKRECLCCLPF
jgi:hypothetical protein